MQSGVDQCDLCGVKWHEGEPPDEWLALEVTRDDGAGGVSWVNADFCSRAHAAEWLQRPLPPAEPFQVLPPTWHDRLLEALALLILLFVVTLMLLGAYAVVRWLGGWD